MTVFWINGAWRDAGDAFRDGLITLNQYRTASGLRGVLPLLKGSTASEGAIVLETIDITQTTCKMQLTWTEIPMSESAPVCTCDIATLMSAGCQCGAAQKDGSIDVAKITAARHGLNAEASES